MPIEPASNSGDGVEQDPSTGLGVTGDQVRRPEAGQRRHAVRIGIIDRGGREAAGRDHPVDPAVAHQDLGDRDQAAAAGAGDAALRVRAHQRHDRPTLGPLEIAGQREDHRGLSGERSIAVPDAAVVEPAEPAADRLHPPVVDGLLADREDQPGRQLLVARRDRVFEGRLGHPLLRMPAGRSPPQLGGRDPVPALELRPEEVAEQVMEAVPGPLRVERDEEQVAPLDPIEVAATVVAIQHVVTERPG